MTSRLIRWLCAAIVLVYGFAKLNGSQFTVLDSEMDKPMGQVSGFWLTWYYFGYSKVYGTTLALVQIGGAILLTFRRTALLGACVLAPVLVNIVFINLCYGVDLGATLVASFLLCGMLSILAPYKKELHRLFFGTQVSHSRPSLAIASTKWLVRVAMVTLTFGFTYWVANFNNRAPSPIDGAWTVTTVEPAWAAETLPTTLYFEHNRAYMAVFKLRDGSYKTHHFEAGEKSSELKMWTQWRQRGQEIFTGNFVLTGAELRLTGAWHDVGPIMLTLTRRAVRQGSGAQSRPGPSYSSRIKRQRGNRQIGFDRSSRALR
jgi:hypothetical protein